MDLAQEAEDGTGAANNGAPNNIAQVPPGDLITAGLPALRPSGRASAYIMDFPSSPGLVWDLMHQPGVVYVMFDFPGYGSEYHPVHVTRVDEVDESGARSADDMPASNIMRGEGQLLSQLGAAWRCGNASLGALCRFRYDGEGYLVAENALDFVWVPSDGFHRTRGPARYRRDVGRWLQGLGPGLPNAYELYRRLYWAHYEIDEQEVDGPVQDFHCAAAAHVPDDPTA
jgi:hypothetical protein